MPEVTRLIDFSQPVGLIFNAVIHHMSDDEDPYRLVERYKAALAPGSYLDYPLDVGSLLMLAGVARKP
jgi:hypothetical protein